MEDAEKGERIYMDRELEKTKNERRKNETNGEPNPAMRTSEYFASTPAIVFPSLHHYMPQFCYGTKNIQTQNKTKARNTNREGQLEEMLTGIVRDGEVLLHTAPRDLLPTVIKH